jgi:predicted nucleic acid-binding protein
MIYALDTDIVIRYLRKVPRVRQNVHEAVMRGDDLVIPKVVNCEVMRGFRVLPAPAKQAAYNLFTGKDGRCVIADMDDRSWERAEQVYAGLYRNGFTIGEMDILIAAFCIEHGYTLVTHNTRDFEKVDGLNIVDWVSDVQGAP